MFGYSQSSIKVFLGKNKDIKGIFWIPSNLFGYSQSSTKVFLGKNKEIQGIFWIPSKQLGECLLKDRTNGDRAYYAIATAVGRLGPLPKGVKNGRPLAKYIFRYAKELTIQPVNELRISLAFQAPDPLLHEAA